VALANSGCCSDLPAPAQARGRRPTRWRFLLVGPQIQLILTRPFLAPCLAGVGAAALLLLLAPAGSCSWLNPKALLLAWHGPDKWCALRTCLVPAAGRRLRARCVLWWRWEGGGWLPKIEVWRGEAKWLGLSRMADTPEGRRGAKRGLEGGCSGCSRAPQGPTLVSALHGCPLGVTPPCAA